MKDVDLQPFTGELPKEAKEASVMKLAATVDVKPQPLKTIRPFTAMIGDIPPLLRAEGKIVLQALFACFERQRVVKEGLVDDLVFGFDAGGIPKQLTLVGLKAISKLGYIKLTAPGHGTVDFESSHILKAWVTYEKKLLDLVYGG